MAVTRGLMQFSGKRSHKVEASMLYGYSRLSSQSFNANEICSFWREKRILIYSEILYLQILFTNIISFPKNIRKEIREKK